VKPIALRERDHFLGFFRRAGADHAADGNVKFRMGAQVLETVAQIVQDLLGRLIALDAVDRDLHLLQTGVVEFLDQLRFQKETVGDHAGAEETELAAAANEPGQLWMERWFAAGE